ncbi:VacJ family lipoprotein [Parasphingopyxis sp. GrpM-11]|uniref:VacJ family lipoprotein n=1 Tax=Parasphingopyxis marina TaxID=2761622 RepID=A0A842I364_9SPHN|nr:VacJ family lipoprotein [Parasphingopyxis marina]
MLMLLMLGGALGGCATTQAGPNSLADRDPHEEFNRDIWSANQAADGAVIRPVSDVYRAVAPRPARRGISNFLRNLGEPWSFINNLLQGHPDRAIRNLGRFIVNTTVGVGGLADVATEIGIEPAPEDFGQTLAVWGVGDGGYRVVPLLGPTTGRDLVGSIVGFIADPATIFLDTRVGLSTQELWGLRGVSIIDTRANLSESGADAFLETSADPYAAARSAYFQQREADILNLDPASLGESEDAAFEAAFDDLDEAGGEDGNFGPPPADEADFPGSDEAIEPGGTTPETTPELPYEESAFLFGQENAPYPH